MSSTVPPAVAEPTAAAPVVAQITVSPSTADAILGSQSPLTATVVDMAGKPITGSDLTWSSSDPNTVVVSSAGIMTAASEGVATITASAHGKSADATIRVVSGNSDTSPTDNVVVTPASPKVEIGSRVQLSSEVRTPSGNVIMGRSVRWSSSNPAIATVSASGIVQGVSEGVTGIQATAGAKSSTVNLTVVQPQVATVAVSPSASQLKAGGTVYLSAIPKDANGQPLAGRGVTWSSSNQAVAKVTTSGNVTAVGGGDATITAFADGIAGKADITVAGAPATPAPPPVATVTVTPQSPALVVGQTLQMNAEVKDAAGTVLTGQTITWTSSNSGVASVTGSGLVTAIAAGGSSMTATAGGKSGSSLVAVSSTPAPIPPAPPTGPGAAGLFNDYRGTAPHYQHISMMVTEWRISGEPSVRGGEYDWLLGHYDHLMGARSADVKSRMPSVTNIPYAIYLSVIQPNTGEPDQIGSVYYTDMVRWYGSHPQYNIESAFLHNPTGGLTAANRKAGSIWGSKRWFINVGDAGMRAYDADRLARVASQTAGFPDDGVFIDEHDGGSIGLMIPSAEYGDYNALQPAIVGMLQAIRGGLGAGKTLMINTAESTSPNTVAQVAAAGAAHLEQVNNPLREMIPRWNDIESMLGTGAVVQLVTGLTDSDYDTQLAGWTPGNETSPAKRGRMFELASYYMVLTTPSKLLLTTYNGQWGQVTFTSNWIKAIEANVGAPQAARSLYRSGTDGIGRPYQVWSRAFSRALVLSRPQFSWAYTQYDDATAVTVPLPAGETWHLLRSDGTVSAAVTSVTLRNAEAAILIKASSL